MNSPRRPSPRFLATTASTSRARRLGAVALLGLGSVLGACTDPPIDDNQPPPTGVISGTIQYIGPRVRCTYVGGVPRQVDGRVLLTLVDDRNPLPPEGTAQRPADFLAVGGEDIFTDLATECLPETPTPQDRAVIIQRTVTFRWAEIPLGAELDAASVDDPVARAAAESRYRIQGFYDQEGDFNPLFSVQQSTSAGDIAGGALENPTAAVTKFLVIRFDSQTLRPQGQLVTGVNVSLGAMALTDPGIFRVLDGDISSEATTPFPPLAGGFPALSYTLYGRNESDADRGPIDDTMEALALDGFTDFSDEVAYAFYVAPIDVDRDGSATCTPNMGDPDCHPIIGDFSPVGIPWYSPAIFLQRAQSAVETAAGIPTVALIPASGIEPTGNPGAQYPDLTVRVAPIAAVLPSPTHPECRAVYFANGTNATIVSLLGSSLPAGSVGECMEVPTGFYGTNMLGGYVGSPAMVSMPGVSATTETGYEITGASFASQVWRVPNEYGDYHQVGDVRRSGAVDPGPFRCLPSADTTTAAPLCLPEQSLAGAVVVHDPNPTNPYGRRASGGGAVCTQYDLSVNPWADGTDYAEDCCAPIRHLCDVPLCATAQYTQTWSDEAGEMNMNIASSPTSIVGTATYVLDGRTHEVGIPNCIPFDMPTQCCPGSRP